jgi:hypothetical protein
VGGGGVTPCRWIAARTILKESYAQPAGGSMVAVEGGRDCTDFDDSAGDAVVPDDEFVGAGNLFA